MKKKLILLISMMLLLIVSLVGCGAKQPTVEEVLDKMESSMEDVTSMESTLALDIEMTMESQGVEATMEIDGEFDFEVLNESEDESITHISGLMSMDAMDEVIEEEFESYTVVDGDEVTTYTSSYGYWVKETSEVDDDNDSRNVFDFSDFEEDLKLEEEIEKYNGVDCYVLRGKVDSDSLDTFPTVPTDSFTDAFEDSVDMYMTIFVNKKTYNLVGFVVSADKLEEEADGITISLDKMEMSLTVKGINCIDKIKIPKSALNATSEDNYNYEEDDFFLEDSVIVEDDDDTDGGIDSVIEDKDKEDLKKPSKDDDKQKAENEEDEDTSSSSTEEEDKDKKDKAPSEGICSSPWTDMKFMFEGKELHLSDPYSTFEVNGWHYSPEDNGVTADYVLNANEYTFGITSLSHDKYDDFEVDVNVGFSNPNSSTTKLTDCNIWTFSADVYYAMKNSSKYPSMSVNGLQFGDSEDKLLEKLGTGYYSTYHSDSLGYTTYEYMVDYDMYFELCVYPDYGITEMSLKLYP